MPIESFCSGTAAIVVFLIASFERRMSATALTVLAVLFLICLDKGSGFIPSVLFRVPRNLSACGTAGRRDDGRA